MFIIFVATIYTMAKIKSPGRQPGIPNPKSAFLRDEICARFRCSRGFKEVVNELKVVAGYKSESDIMHEAVQILAARKLPADFYWRDKIM